MIVDFGELAAPDLERAALVGELLLLGRQPEKVLTIIAWSSLCPTVRSRYAARFELARRERLDAEPPT